MTRFWLLKLKEIPRHFNSAGLD
ncbi:hypothetical protein CCACVL1_27004 [Corchorus capsularis]|uniref:Uncharacterized protein n=1 Tax=Corchorus capsularis TaxID=210143 RepID=A0A1R3GCK5_COCAP|nr:hypothetical protein CCACVL1_27004 [Corchorus capsularis]